VDSANGARCRRAAVGTGSGRGSIGIVGTCGHDSEPQSRLLPDATYLGHLTEPLNSTTVNFALKPPPNDVVPQIDPETAYLKAGSQGFPEQGPTIVLAVADLPASRDTSVYVLRWENVPVSGGGGPAPPPGEWTPPVLQIGVRISVIDATSGEHLITMVTNEPGA
jgi:hypothetical protein